MLTQIILPLAVFVGVIVGITVAANLVPPTKPPGPGPEVKGDPLNFPYKTAIWEPRDQAYRAEFEKNTTGHYCFWVRNTQKEPSELGFAKKSCACARVEFCLLEGKEALALSEARRFEEHLFKGASSTSESAGAILPMLGAASVLPGPAGPTGILSLIDEGIRGNDGLGGLLGTQLDWQPLSEDEHKDRGIVVPAGAVGLIRLSWNSRNRENEQVTLATDLWMKVQGSTASRRLVTLTVPVAFVPAMRIFPEKIDISRWNEAGIGRGEIRCWSSTRVDFPLIAEERTGDPCVEAKATRLSGSECRQLEQDIRTGQQIPTRVLSGYRVRVLVKQEKGNNRLELGRFQRWISLISRGIGVISGVEVTGTVYSDVVVGQEQNAGSIKLGSFEVSSGKYLKTYLETKPGVELALATEKDRRSIIPDFMKVELKREDDGQAGGAAKWLLVVDIPPGAAGAVIGGWPKDGSITIQKKHQGKTRLIRIPVEANPFRRGG